jgi:hypothetical protein
MIMRLGGRPKRSGQSTRCHDHGLRSQRELADDVARTLAPARDVAWRQNFATYPVNRPAGAREFVDAVPEFERDQALLRTFAYPLHERGDNARPSAPGDVKARHGIPVSDRVAAAALRPPDDGKELDAALA